jgi:hypothetical protein
MSLELPRTQRSRRADTVAVATELLRSGPASAARPGDAWQKASSAGRGHWAHCRVWLLGPGRATRGDNQAQPRVRRTRRGAIVVAAASPRINAAWLISRFPTRPI